MSLRLVVMPKIKKTQQLQNLAQYQTWRVDTDPASRYFKLSQFPDILTAGKNAFLVAGSDELVPTTEVLVELVDADGKAVYMQPIARYEEGLSRLVSVEIYEDTAPGLATLTILGHLVQDAEGELPPDEFKNSYNVKWQRQIVIAPKANNTTSVRLYKLPHVTVSEVLVPYLSSSATAPVNVSTGSVVVSTRQPSPGNEDRRLTYVTLVGAPTGFSRDMEGGTFQALMNGTALSASIDIVLNKSALILSGAGAVSGSPLSYSITYTPAATYAQTFVTRSFADIKVSNLTTFAGEVARARVLVKSIDQRGDYQSIADVPVVAADLTLAHAVATGQPNVSIGDFRSQNIISSYWESGRIVGASYVIDSSAPLAPDSSVLLDAMHINTGSVFTPSSVPAFFMATNAGLPFTASLEYAMSFNLACVNNNVPARIDVYLEGVAFPSSAADYYGQKIASYTVASANTQFDFGKQQINFTALSTGTAKVRLVVYTGDWYVSRLTVASADDVGFNPDELAITVPVNNRRLETLQFKVELVDGNGVKIPVNLESALIPFNGGNTVIQGPDNQVPGKITVGTTGPNDGGGITITGNHTGSNGSGPAIFMGSGSYSSSDTPFFMQSGSGGIKFSLGPSMTWDGTTLTVVGLIRQRLPSQGGGVIPDYINRGTWAFPVSYSVYDLVQYSGSTYFTTTTHVSTQLSNPINSSSLFAVFAAGASGSAAKLVTLSSDGQAFTFDSGNLASPASQSITFTALTQNITGSVNWTSAPLVTLGGAGNIRTLSVVDFGANSSVQVTAESEGFTDRITVYRLRSGGQGADGRDAVVAFLTNEAHTVQADALGIVSSLAGADTLIKVFGGTSDITSTYTFTKTDIVVSSSLSGSGTSAPQITITAFPPTADIGYVDITGSRASYPTVNKRFSVAKSKTGLQGASGSQGPSGSAGSNAQLLALLASAQTFTYDGNNIASPISQSIIFTAVPQNLAGTITFTTNPTLTLSGSGNVRVLDISNFGSILSASVTASLGGFSDYITLYRLRGGVSGSPGPSGSVGPSGSDAYTMLLTNESHTLPAVDGGTVLSFAGAATIAKVFKGVVDVTSQYTFVTNNSFVTTSLSGNGTSTPTVTVTDLPTAYDNGYSDITGSASGQPTLSKRFSISKSKTGIQGVPGVDGTNAKSLRLLTTTQVLTYNSGNVLTPANQVIFLTAATGSTTGTVTWSSSPSGALSNILGTFAVISGSRIGANTASIGVTASVEGLTDYVTIVKLRDGSLGPSASFAWPLVYTEEWTALPTASGRWVRKNGTNPTESIASLTDSQTGGTALRVEKYGWYEWSQNVPFDSNKLYYIKIRVRQTQAPTDGISTILYCGVSGIAADGTTYVNAAGANSNAAQHFVAASNITLSSGSAWNEYTGYFKGWGTYVANANSIDNPSPLHSNVRYMRPVFIVNYNGGDGIAEVDMLEFPAIQPPTGPSGSAAISAFLTNEAQILPADASGVVSSFVGADTLVKVYEGIVDVSNLYTFTKSDINTTSSIVGNGTVTPDVVVTGINSGSDFGYVDITGSRSAYPNVNKRFSLSKSKTGQSGSAGISAKAISIQGTSQIFTYDGTGILNPSGQIITLTAVTQSITGSVVWGSSPSGVFSGIQGAITRISGSTLGALTASVVVTASADGVSDYFTIIKVRDGASGSIGASGSNTVVGFLTNEAQIVPADFTGVVSSFAGASTAFKVFVGLTDSSNLFSLTKTDVNTTSSISGIGTLNPTVTVVGIDSGSDTGYTDITASLSGFPQLGKRFTITKSKGGGGGANGTNGKVVSLTATSQVFTYDGTNALNPVGQIIGLTIVTQSTAGGITWGTSPSGVLAGISGNRAFISGSTLGLTTASVVVTASVDGLTDYVTIFKVRDGSSGSVGGSGSNAIAGLLTNEAQILPADANGVVTSFVGASTAFKVYIGTTDSSNLATLAKVDVNTTSSISGVGTLNPTVTVVGIDSGSDTGYTDITASVTGYPNIGKRFTLTKSKAGTAGSSGASAKSVSIQGSSQTFTYNGVGVLTPAGQIISLTAVTQSTAGAVTWGTSPSGVLSGILGTLAFISGSALGATTTSVVVTASVDGLVDYFTIVKVRDGASGSAGTDALVGFLTNEAQTLPADTAGIVSSFSGASTVFKIFRGLTDVSNTFSLTKVDTFTTSSISNIGQFNPTVTLTGINSSSDFGYVDITASLSGNPDISKRFSITKSKQGTAGNNGAQGADGAAGPGVVFRGTYSAATAYFHTSIRRDVVQGSDSNYYIVNNIGKNGLTTWGDPAAASADWTAFGAQFSSVATDFLLANDQTITRTLVLGGITNYGVVRTVSASINGGLGLYADGTGALFMGSGSNDFIRARTGSFDIRATKFALSSSTVSIDSAGNGTIRLGSATSFGAGTGLYLDGLGQFRFGNPAGTYMSWDGSTFLLNDVNISATSIFNGGTRGLGAYGDAIPNPDFDIWSATSVPFGYSIDLTSPGSASRDSANKSSGTYAFKYVNPDTVSNGGWHGISTSINSNNYVVPLQANRRYRMQLSSMVSGTLNGSEKYRAFIYHKSDNSVFQTKTFSYSTPLVWQTDEWIFTVPSGSDANSYFIVQFTRGTNTGTVNFWLDSIELLQGIPSSLAVDSSGSITALGDVTLPSAFKLKLDGNLFARGNAQFGPLTGSFGAGKRIEFQDSSMVLKGLRSGSANSIKLVLGDFAVAAAAGLVDKFDGSWSAPSSSVPGILGTTGMEVLGNPVSSSLIGITLSDYPSYDGNYKISFLVSGAFYTVATGGGGAATPYGFVRAKLAYDTGSGWIDQGTVAELQFSKLLPSDEQPFTASFSIPGVNNTNALKVRLTPAVYLAPGALSTDYVSGSIIVKDISTFGSGSINWKKNSSTTYFRRGIFLGQESSQPALFMEPTPVPPTTASSAAGDVWFATSGSRIEYMDGYRVMTLPGTISKILLADSTAISTTLANVTNLDVFMGPNEVWEITWNLDLTLSTAGASYGAAISSSIGTSGSFDICAMSGSTTTGVAQSRDATVEITGSIPSTTQFGGVGVAGGRTNAVIVAKVLSPFDKTSTISVQLVASAAATVTPKKYSTVRAVRLL
jgi:hypothetical protein